MKSTSIEWLINPSQLNPEADHVVPYKLTQAQCIGNWIGEIVEASILDKGAQYAFFFRLTGYQGTITCN